MKRNGYRDGFFLPNEVFQLRLTYGDYQGGLPRRPLLPATDQAKAEIEQELKTIGAL